MYKYLLLGLFILSGAIAFFVFGQDPQKDAERGPVVSDVEALASVETYQDQTYGFAFEYPAGERGYVREEGVPLANEYQDLEQLVVLISADEYAALQSVTGPTETPPTIQVLVFKNELKRSPFVWAQENPQESNIARALGEIEESVVGGANAAHYIADGLYAADTYVVAHGGYIYLLSGMRIDSESKIASDFNALVDSFRFTQPAL